MAVRIYLEIGHEASIRTKKTQEGFTHDWEVFVRGCEGAEIHYYIEKVVFYLHETFPKPKRVVKEPPYSVKESGYAGFNLPIDIYLRNNSEPKKIRFNYDLHLQQSGPPILKVQKEKYIFNSPTDEFKMKLMKGGATIGSSSSIAEVNDTRSSTEDKNQMTNKPKLSGCDLIKKPKIKTGEPRDFQELFGSPITMSSKTSEPKLQQVPKSDSKGLEKSRNKHSPHKDSHKDKEKSKDKSVESEKKSKEERKQKDKSKDRERSKDKSVKKEKSPRPRSPSPSKRSPKRFSSPPVVKHKESKQHDKEKRDKFEDRKMKKEKRSKDHKENKHSEEKTGEEHKEKVKSESKKESSKVKNNENAAASPTPKVTEKKEKTKEKSSTKEGSKEDKSYSEKYSKHKKKDKEKREKKEEKSHAIKAEKKPEKTEPKPNLFKTETVQQPKKEKSYISPSIPNLDEESSNSSTSSSSSSIVVEKKTVKNETVKVKEEKNQKPKKEKSYQDSSAIKCKRKSNSVEIEEPPEKMQHKEPVNNNSDGEQETKTVLPTPQEEEENYFGVLRDLQHKIMGLKDNSDLQKVVKLIAETGRYEVSAHTFDFDLCLLDRSTVQQLQDFFANET